MRHPMYVSRTTADVDGGLMLSSNVVRRGAVRAVKAPIPAAKSIRVGATEASAQLTPKRRS
jgi:hypothetical protein